MYSIFFFTSTHDPSWFTKECHCLQGLFPTLSRVDSSDNTNTNFSIVQKVAPWACKIITKYMGFVMFYFYTANCGANKYNTQISHLLGYNAEWGITRIMALINYINTLRHSQSNKLQTKKQNKLRMHMVQHWEFTTNTASHKNNAVWIIRQNNATLSTHTYMTAKLLYRDSNKNGKIQTFQYHLLFGYISTPAHAHFIHFNYNIFRIIT